MLSHIARRASVAVAMLATAMLATACSEDQLSGQFARYTITAEPTSKQVILDNPVGIDYRKVPIGAPVTATFRIENISSSLLEIQSIHVTSVTNGELEPVMERPVGETRPGVPFEIDSGGTDGDTASLVVTLVPTGADRSLIKGTLDIATNAGETHDEVIHLQLAGEAEFIGEPNLELVYNSKVFSLPESCDPASAAGKCTLEALEFGNVSLSSSTSTSLMLRDVPIAGTCQMRDLSDDPPVPDCTPACAVSFTGLGFDLDNAGFGIAGSAAVPFSIAPFKAGCDSAGRTVRGDLEIVLNFQASDTAGPAASTLILESNDPGAPIIEVPVHASSERAPVAVAAIRECGSVDNPPPACTNPTSIEPLERIYFEGKDSYDPGPATLQDYSWEIVQFPDGASPVACYFGKAANDPSNRDCVYSPNPSTDLLRPDIFNMNIPLAGTYVVRLHVKNSSGVISGISATSDVEFEALPSSRLHLQLVWDHPTNDQDLHMVHVDASGNDRVYSGDGDCFWGDCRPSCGVPLLDPDCTPVQWFTQDPPLAASNPHLDRDDTNGIGPENINVDQPRAGRYRLYVHYYGLTDSTNVPTGVTVRIYIDGLLRQEYRNTLQRNDLWAVAEIVWAADDSALVRSPDPNVDAVQQLIYLPPATEGFAFSPSPF